MSAALRSRADVTTTSPERYAKQLVSHLGHKVDVVSDGATSTLQIDGATGQVVVGDGRISLLASAADSPGLELVEHVLGSHLASSGAQPTVTWQRA